MSTTLLSDFEADGLYLCTAWTEDLFSDKVKGGRYSAESFRIVCKLPYIPALDGRPGNASFRDSLAHRFFETAATLPADHESQISGSKWCMVWREGQARSLHLVNWTGPRPHREHENFHCSL